MDTIVGVEIQMPVKKTTLVNMVEFAYPLMMDQNANVAIKIMKELTAK